MSKTILVVLILTALATFVGASKLLKKAPEDDASFPRTLQVLVFTICSVWFPLALLVGVGGVTYEFLTDPSKRSAELVMAGLFAVFFMGIVGFIFLGIGALGASLVVRLVLGRRPGGVAWKAALLTPIGYALTLESLTRLWGESFLWNSMLP